MHPKLRQRYVQDLTADISRLTGSEFERFGYRILDSLVPDVEWLHRGTNQQGAPVSKVVDSVDQTGSVVGQASSESDYFTGKLEKIHKDIKQTRKNHSGAKSLWLLSNRRMGPTATTKVANLVAAKKKTGLTLCVQDSQAIAEHIVEKLRSSHFTDGLKGFLPMLVRIQNEWAASHRIPDYPDYVRRPTHESEIQERLNNDRYVCIVGISGTGKSALASQVAQDLQDSFELIFWVDASQIRGVEELRSHDVWGNGERYNLLGQLRTSATLLILDDARIPIPKAALLDEDANPGSAVLLTSQFDQDSEYLVPDLTESEAEIVLARTAGSSCPVDVFARLWRACGGHPLILSLIGSIAADEGWGVVLQDCLAPTQLEDEQRQLVCNRVLAKHALVLEQELAFISWVDTARIDESFVRGICGPASVRNLRNRHFLAATRHGLLRIHDIVFQSAKSVQSGTSRFDFPAKTARFFGELADNELELARCARNHIELLHRLLAEPVKPAIFRYALATQWSQPIQHNLLGDPVEQATTLGPDDPIIASRAVFESIEAIFLATAQRSEEEAASILAKQLPAFDLLEQANQARPDFLRDIRHHRGKALRWLERKTAAEDCFRSLLEDDPDFAAGRLQLARLLSQDKERAREASSEVNKILQLAESHPESVSRNVLLAAFELAGRNELSEFAAEIVSSHLELLRKAVLETSPFSGEQALSALTRLATAVRYKHPDVLNQLLPLVPESDLACASTDLKFNLAQLKKLRAKAELSSELGLKPPSWSDDAFSNLEEAETIYMALPGGHPYHAVQHAENLILLGQPEKALKELGKVPDAKRSHYWEQRHAQAQRLTGDHAGALVSINTALNADCGKFRAAYLYTRWQIRAELDQPTAHEDLDEAIACCEDPRFRNSLTDLRSRTSPPPTG